MYLFVTIITLFNIFIALNELKIVRLIKLRPCDRYEVLKLCIFAYVHKVIPVNAFQFNFFFIPYKIKRGHAKIMTGIIKSTHWEAFIQSLSLHLLHPKHLQWSSLVGFQISNIWKIGKVCSYNVGMTLTKIGRMRI